MREAAIGQDQGVKAAQSGAALAQELDAARVLLEGAHGQAGAPVHAPLAQALPQQAHQHPTLQAQAEGLGVEAVVAHVQHQLALGGVAQQAVQAGTMFQRRLQQAQVLQHLLAAGLQQQAGTHAWVLRAGLGQGFEQRHLHTQLRQADGRGAAGHAGTDDGDAAHALIRAKPQ